MGSSCNSTIINDTDHVVTIALEECDLHRYELDNYGPYRSPKQLVDLPPNQSAHLHVKSQQGTFMSTFWIMIGLVRLKVEDGSTYKVSQILHDGYVPALRWIHFNSWVSCEDAQRLINGHTSLGRFVKQGKPHLAEFADLSEARFERARKLHLQSKGAMTDAFRKKTDAQRAENQASHDVKLAETEFQDKKRNKEQCSEKRNKLVNQKTNLKSQLTTCKQRIQGLQNDSGTNLGLIDFETQLIVEPTSSVEAKLVEFGGEGQQVLDFLPECQRIQREVNALDPILRDVTNAWERSVNSNQKAGKALDEKLQQYDQKRIQLQKASEDADKQKKVMFEAEAELLRAGAHGLMIYRNRGDLRS